MAKCVQCPREIVRAPGQRGRLRTICVVCAPTKADRKRAWNDRHHDQILAQQRKTYHAKKAAKAEEATT